MAMRFKSTCDFSQPLDPIEFARTVALAQILISSESCREKRHGSCEP